MADCRLIVTLGASGGSKVHQYCFADGKCYETAYSMEAVAKHYNATEVFIIGTEDTVKMVKSHPPTLSVIPKFLTVPLGERAEEYLYNEVIKLFDYRGDIILDVTQGYRAFPMLTLLASMFPQHQKNRKTRLKEILYASTLDPHCAPGREKCQFKFVSLLSYIYAANMSEIILSFISSLSVPGYSINYKEFQPLEGKLRHIAKSLVNNEIITASSYSKRLSKDIEILKKKTPHMITALEALEKDVKYIQKIASEKSQANKLFMFNEYMLSKGYTLQSVTLLYEAITQFLYEYLNNKGHLDRLQDGVGKLCKKQHNVYKIKNCIKKNLSRYLESLDCNDKDKAILDELNIVLYIIDDIRNKAAHAFLDDYYTNKIKQHYKKMNMDINWAFEKKVKEINEILSERLKLFK